MNIAVFVKQVPDTSEVKINPETGTLIRSGVPSIINPYDHFALQTAVEIKKHTPCKISVICMGPTQAKSVVQMGLALGADEGYLLSDRAVAGSDTWATSYALSQVIKTIGKTDLILCGMQAIDGDTAQTGPAMAQHLGIPQITFCESVKIDGNKVIARKHIDGGYEIAQCAFPVLLTMVMPSDYVPAYPSFLDIHESLSKPYRILSAADIKADPQYLGLKGSPTRVNKIYPPAAREKAQMFKCSGQAAADKILEIMKKEHFIEE